MAVQPGGGSLNGPQFLNVDGCADLSANLKLLIAVGDQDKIVGDKSALHIWAQTNHIKNRVFYRLRSDSHGLPRIRATHLAPLALNLKNADALDWFGLWLPFDKLREASFSKKIFQLKAPSLKWSDGTPIKLMEIE
jgi:hypothetical protein